MRRPSYVAQQSKSKSSSIGGRSHLVTLCTADDIVIDGGTIVLERRKAVDVWAGIRESRGSTWSREGFAVKEPTDNPSHCITIRYQGDAFIVTSTAWIYEARRQAPARWFKVLKVHEVDDTGLYPWHWELRCRLVEKSDTATTPRPVEGQASSSPMAMPLPPGVVL